MQKYAKSHKTRQNHADPAQNHVKPRKMHSTTQNDKKPHETMWNYEKPHWTTQNHAIAKPRAQIRPWKTQNSESRMKIRLTRKKGLRRLKNSEAKAKHIFSYITGKRFFGCLVDI